MPITRAAQQISVSDGTAAVESLSSDPEASATGTTHVLYRDRFVSLKDAWRALHSAETLKTPPYPEISILADQSASRWMQASSEDETAGAVLITKAFAEQNDGVADLASNNQQAAGDSQTGRAEMKGEIIATASSASVSATAYGVHFNGKSITDADYGMVSLIPRMSKVRRFAIRLMNISLASIPLF